MIKKTQKYLLLHHPLIWNIKLIPMLLILAGLHSIFFVIGYLTTDVAFDSSCLSSNPLKNNGLLYTSAVLMSILLLIGWLVFYSRNNALKNLYPTKASRLYLEWILIFTVTTTIAFLPISIAIGTTARWQSVASEGETREALALLAKVKILIPNNIDDYKYDAERQGHHPLAVKEGTIVGTKRLQMENYSFDYDRKKNIVINGYIGNSLLFYTDDTNYYDYEDKELDAGEIAKQNSQKKIREWLITEKKDSIYGVMLAFNKLQEKNDMQINLSAKQWFKRVYKPPYYPINKYNSISAYDRHEYDSNRYDSDRYDGTRIEGEESLTIDTIALGEAAENEYYDEIERPYLQYSELEAGYEACLNSHADYEALNWITLFCISSALWISFFIFSFRVTSGKSWLIAFVGTGVLIFGYTLLLVLCSMMLNFRGEAAFIFFGLFWYGIFTVFIATIIRKIRNKSSKGKTMITNNLLLWLVPCIFPLGYGFYYNIQYFVNDATRYYYNNDNQMMWVFYLNIPFVIGCMWFVTRLIRQWKSLPEE